MDTFAIGDIHGCLDQLTEVLARIDLLAGSGPLRIVCLGDYVDRGRDSAGVIALLRERQKRAPPGGVICLKGNHEDMLLAARARRTDVAERLWLDNGGEDCLASFGVFSVDGIPEDVISWIADCPTVFEDEWRCFVHAGLDPLRPRLDQTDRTRLWIREPFLSADHDFGRMVVHGHTPCRSGSPDVRRNRIDLDTGAVYGGPLTAALFVDGERNPKGFLQVR